MVILGIQTLKHWKNVKYVYKRQNPIKIYWNYSSVSIKIVRHCPSIPGDWPSGHDFPPIRNGVGFISILRMGSFWAVPLNLSSVVVFRNSGAVLVMISGGLFLATTFEEFLRIRWTFTTPFREGGPDWFLSIVFEKFSVFVVETKKTTKTETINLDWSIVEI